MRLTKNEIYQVQFVLPIQGNLIDLEMASQILNKLNIKEEDLNNISIKENNFIDEDINFLDEEIKFLQSMIKFLDNAKKLNIQGLSLYRKILGYKGVENGPFRN